MQLNLFYKLGRYLLAATFIIFTLNMHALAVDKDELERSMNLLMIGQQSGVAQLKIDTLRSMRDQMGSNFDSVVNEIREKGAGSQFPPGYAKAIEKFLRASYSMINEAVNYYDAKGGWDKFVESSAYKSAQKRLEGAYGDFSDATIEFYRLNKMYPNAVAKYDRWKSGKDDTSEGESAVGWKCKFSGTIHKSKSDCANSALGGSWVLR